MAVGHLDMGIRHLRSVLERQEAAGMMDGDLLKRYVQQRDEAAFEALVRRHGQMVLGVCRRVLHNSDDAEDAFQATFLVLVRKASSLRSPGMLGNWLYGVAHRTAQEAKRAANKRRAKEAKVTPRTEAPKDSSAELRRLLDQELERLPDKYRAVVIICDLEGKTRKEAARQLGWPEGTVAGRLARARTMLAKRLARHRLMLSAGALAAALSQNATASVSSPLLVATVHAASLFAAGQAAATSVVSTKVAALAEGVLKIMMLTKLKTASVVLLMVLFGIGSGVLIVSAVGSRAAVAEDKKPEASGADAPKRSDVPSIAVTATDVFRAYGNNEALADEKFTGTRLQVTGNMQRIRRFGKNYVLTMTAWDPDRPMWFEFEDKDRKQLATLEPGQELTIQGQCDGSATVNADRKDKQVIRFRNCEILKAKRTTDEKGEKGRAKKP